MSSLLHASPFLRGSLAEISEPLRASYYYEGCCPITGQTLRLPRTALAEEVARGLMSRLPAGQEGKMFGVLIVELPSLELAVLQAFSGLLEGRSELPGWVPPIATQEPSDLERQTLAQLALLKLELTELVAAPERQQLAAKDTLWDAAGEQMQQKHRAAKAERDSRRGQGLDDSALDQESRAHSSELRRHRQQRDLELGPLRDRLRMIEERMLAIKNQRRSLSKTLQAELHANFGQALFQGEPWSLASLFPSGPPTGTGECCAPKLLHYACIHELRPVAMAEFWWGLPSPGGGKQPGHFYGACAERCQPLLGPLLAGLRRPLQIIYEDEDLIAVDKPSGVLTVPGRTSANQDSLFSRLGSRFGRLLPVHRLDLETSGVVLLARSRAAQAALQRQFAAREVNKSYLAVLEDCPSLLQGVIDLPLGRDPLRSGRYRPDPQGKAARTRYRVIDGARLLVQPESGRSHQIRIHMASGLGHAVRGDRLYGRSAGSGRLMLHAWRLEFLHPVGGIALALEAPPAF